MHKAKLVSQSDRFKKSKNKINHLYLKDGRGRNTNGRQQHAKRHKGRGRRQLCNSAHLHVHTELKAITLQLLLRSLGVIVSD